jgi:hypothetical protein
MQFAGSDAMAVKYCWRTPSENGRHIRISPGGTAARRLTPSEGQYVAWVGCCAAKRPDVIYSDRSEDARGPLVCVVDQPHIDHLQAMEKVVKVLQGLANVKFLKQVSPKKAQQIIANSSAPVDV